MQTKHSVAFTLFCDDKARLTYKIFKLFINVTQKKLVTSSQFLMRIFEKHTNKLEKYHF